MSVDCKESLTFMFSEARKLGVHSHRALTIAFANRQAGKPEKPPEGDTVS